jgi:uncharacterized membrane protein HdeD (DUF308 family)
MAKGKSAGKALAEEFGPVQRRQKRARSYWWATLLRGILAVIFGLLVLFWPGISLLTFVMVASVFVLLGGIVSLCVAVAAATDHNKRTDWVAPLILGILEIIGALILLTFPLGSAFVFLLILAILLIIRGVADIALALTDPGDGWDRAWLGIGGLFLSLIGVLFLANPGDGLLTMTMVIGIGILLAGVMWLMLAYKLKRLADTLSKR